MCLTPYQTCFKFDAETRVNAALSCRVDLTPRIFVLVYFLLGSSACPISLANFGP